MLDIQHNISLQPFNTLALPASARYFVRIDNRQQLPEAMAFARKKQLPTLILGGGSNIVLRGDFPGLVIKIALLGVQFERVNDVQQQLQQVRVTAAAGENWNNLVQTALARHCYGLENLALIPGSVGAAPIQNIGAYGVEFEQVFDCLTGWDCEHDCWRTLTATDCEFGYRDSIFKRRLKNRFVITCVTLTLHLNPQVDTGYQALRAELKKNGLDPGRDGITPQQVANAVAAVRRSKLPDPQNIPNAGSFFKNPVLMPAPFAALQKNYPDIVHYRQPDGRIKIAAGWLLEQAGWRGKQCGPVGMHSAQSLVLINHGAATGADVLTLAGQIQRDIKRRFGVHLEIEPALY